MALDPSDRYPGQIDVTDPTGYPYGAAQNITVVGDGTGTPWEQDLVNDIFGFQQALLDDAGMTPSGDPDKVGASQYLEALKQVILGTNFIGLSAVDGTFTVSLTMDPGSELLVDVGAHLQCDGTAEFTGVTSFGFPVALSGGFTSGGASVFNGSATFNGAGVGLKVTTAAEIDGAALVSGVLSAPAGIIVGTSGIIVGGGGAILVTGSTHLQGPTELADPVTLTGDGHIRKRVVDAPDSDETFSILTADEVHVPNTLSTGRTYALSTSGAQDGAQFTAVTYYTANPITFGGLLMQANTAGATWSATWTFKSGAWRLVHTSFITP